MATAINAQSYEQDWKEINNKLESGDSVPVVSLTNFSKKYAALLSKYPDNSTQLYSILGNNYSLLNNVTQAEINYLLSLEYAQTARDTSLKHIVELSLAILNQNANNYLEAEKYYLKCMAGMAAVYGQSSREYTEIFYNYTGLLIGLGKYNDAHPYIDALLYYYKTLDGENNIRYVTLLYYKAIVLQNLGDYTSAIQIFEQEVQNKRILKLGDTVTYVTGISNLGDVYREAGYYENATSHLENAKTLYQHYKLHDHHLLATIENNLGLCYKGLSDPQKAEQAYANAQAIYETHGETFTESYCTTLSNKGNLYSGLGRYGQASELLWTSIEIRKQNFGGNSENYANALANLANVFFASGYYQKALEKNLEANAVYKTTVGENHQGYANNLNSLSLCYLQFDDYKKAEAYKLEALSIIEKTVGKNHYRYASYLISTGELYRQMSRYDQAEKNLMEALALIEKNLGVKHELYARAQFGIAEIYSLQKKFAAATPFYFGCMDYYSGQIDAYFDAMSESNQMNFIQLITPVFESYNSYVINYRQSKSGADLSEQLIRAYKYQLQLKSLLANRSAQLRKQVLAGNDETLKEQYAEWLSLKNELIDRYKSTDRSDDNNDLFAKISTLETGIKSKVSNFSTKKSISYEQLRQSLSATEGAIEIFKVSELQGKNQVMIKYGALIATKKSAVPAFVIFENGAWLDSVAFEHYYACIEGQISDTVSYGRYFQSFYPWLRGIKKVYVSADGIFHKISFSGLYVPSAKNYVCDEFEIVQTSNLGSMYGVSKTPVNKTACLFGYPDYEYDFNTSTSPVNPLLPGQMLAKRFGLVNLSKLPGTKVEVEQISRELKTHGWKTEVFTEQWASEEKVRQTKSPGVLHIATHGFYLKSVESQDKTFLGFDKAAIQRDPLLRSGLILAGAGPSTQDTLARDSKNDGILTAGEASLLNLNGTDLVVLSACQTGLGDEFGTEGVAGLQRSFTIAGAKNILMSLWPVDDYATQYLMTRFYENYAVEGDVASAFIKARQAVKEKYPHPYYWAAFVLLKTFN